MWVQLQHQELLHLWLQEHAANNEQQVLNEQSNKNTIKNQMAKSLNLLRFLILMLFATSSHILGEETGQNSTALENKKEEASKTDPIAKESKKAETSKKDNGDPIAKESKKDDKNEDETNKDNPDIITDKPPRIGNFSLPLSQQPAALFGFGGNIIEKGEVQLYFFADDFVGRNKITTDLIPGILFGITDDWSIFFNFPVTPILKDGRFTSSGFEDFFVQFEYAFYNKTTLDYEDQATFVFNATVPTGSIKKNPPTGFGSPSLFLGGTYYRTYVDWFLFTSHGAVLTTSEHRTKFGDQFLYQFGFGKNMPSPEDWIYAWMLEVDGQYNKKNRIDGAIDPNSGGNTIYVTPSLWFSSKEVLVQFGVSIPVNQHLFGRQRKFDYALNFNFAWSFY
jgi:hypothetical protein